MKQMGNICSNQIYNPKNSRPPVPIDADEADSAMERFIRAKYKDNSPADTHDYEAAPSRRQKTYENTHDYNTAPGRRQTASSDSDDQPPPPPPKTTSRFGFRSTSSIFPMSSKAKREAAARAYLENQQEIDRREESERPIPPRKNKPARIFGTADRPSDEMDAKLAQLRDMGFTDERKNLTVLKGLSGNLEKSVETLVRLGMGSNPPSRSRTPAPAPASAGLSISRPKESPISPTYSNDPWEMPPAQTQSSQSTGGLPFPSPQDQQNTNVNTLNPFGLVASRSQYNLNQQYTNPDQSLQNLSVSPNQPLFPNHTGGAPKRQPFQAAAAPSMPSIPQGQYASVVYEAQPQAQYSQDMNQGYNPFLQQQAPQPQNFNAAPVAAVSSNPFGTLQRNQTFPMLQGGSQGQQQQQSQDYFTTSHEQTQPQPQHQPNPYGQHLQAQQQAPQQQSNLFNESIQQQPQQQQPQYQLLNPYNQPQQTQQPQNPYTNPQYQQQMQPQPTGRADKSSILALYNYSQFPPTATPQQPQADNQPQPQTQSQNPYQPQEQTQNQNPYQLQTQSGNTQPFINPAAPPQQHPQNISSPLSSQVGFGGSKNPFMNNTSQQSAFPQNAQSNGTVGNTQGGLLAASGIGGIGGANGNATRHVSHESMSIDPNGWHGHSGRHSPDAFASLSARAMR